ncbi:YheC/YheD family protein [Paenibacillus sp. HB172176]|uniref:YheC/YheD family endospore coat-associated protein n=1 Tax=Paenibacillus sp. HB172176 TaxID=2493690 RepID=UPI00143A04DE|nr:YheC/YheD family protein [Paenibacillus sp. HB172176]
MTQPILGILTLYLNDAGVVEEKAMFRKMTIEGRKLGLRVFVFTPQDVNHDKKRIRGLHYNESTRAWYRKWTSFPHMIFDRCRIQQTPRFQQLLKFRSRYQHLTFLNRPLRNKWTIHSLLAKDERFSSFLPKTRYIDSVKDIHSMLRSHRLLYLKPVNGTGGRGILRIEKLRGGRLLVQGRNQDRRIVQPQRMNESQLDSYLGRWDLKNIRYIVQQGIQLKLKDGRVHDYRLLVQKNGSGEWQVTGCAGRIGPPGSITANLHGGGKAVKMDELLKEWITDETKISSVKSSVSEFGIAVSQYLELCYGALCELAIDIAIDRQGKIWMIEVNPKPAREVFARAGEGNAYMTAIRRPLEYAIWKHQQKQKNPRPNGTREAALSGERDYDERETNG